jgi:hypothetical protein
MNIETKITWDTNSAIEQMGFPVEIRRALVTSVFRRFLLHPLTISTAALLVFMAGFQVAHDTNFLFALPFFILSGLLQGVVSSKASAFTYIEEGLRTRTNK